MNNKLKIVITPLIIALSACGSSSDDSDPNAPAGSAVSILTVSGVTEDLTGIWKTVCYTGQNLLGAPADAQETIEFSNTGTVSYVSNSFPSTDASCAGFASVMRGYNANIAVQSTLAISGWEDGNKVSTVAPTAQDGSSLSDNESFTHINYILTYVNNLGNIGIGTVVQEGYIADDTGAGPTMLYRLDNKLPQATLASTVDPFTKM